MRFLAIGECMAELAPTSELDEFHLGFAGDTFNTAWYLARLCPDMDVGYYTAIGSDTLSQRLRNIMIESGIDDSTVSTVQERTLGLYMISLDNGERSFTYWRDHSAAKLLAQNPAALAAAMDNADTLYLSGITLAILDETSRSTLFAALNKAKQQGARVVFDSNMRERLWPSATAMTDAVMQAAAVSTLVLPSFDEESQWFGDNAPATTAKRYADAGVETVIVKNGSSPVFYCHGDELGEVAVPPLASIIDTTAAGDSFNAGFIAGLHNNINISDSISLANRLAANVVQGRGALVPVNADMIIGNSE